ALHTPSAVSPLAPLPVGSSFCSRLVDGSKSIALCPHFRMHPNPDGTGVNGDPLDSYTPANFALLGESDTDLGSAEPAILPAPPTSKIRHIGLQASKDYQLRLLDLDKLSGSGQPGATGGDLQTIPIPQGGLVLTAPAVWVNPADQSTWAFISNPQGISALQLTANLDGTPALQLVWKQTRGGTSPLIANGVLYVAKSNNIRAFDPATGKMLWQDTTIGELHWQSPVVVNGVLYIGDNGGALHAYALP
ncbi:MAG: outer membrane protein assembly factor BamB family protein, partial [Aggregatilineales bacterium]